MKTVTLSAETIDAITADGIRNIRQLAECNQSPHPLDKRSNEMMIAACDMLLSHLAADPWDESS